jgi:phosphopantetheinyl transferase
MLTPGERVTLASLREPRATEWTASRVAAKRCLVRLLHPPPPPDRVEVERDDSGVPWALVGRRRLPLSLSHAPGWAVAAAHARLRVGVDVEPLRALPHAFSRYFLSPDESSALGGWGDPATASLAAWTAKEAVLKAIGCGLSIPPRAVRIRSLDADGRVAVAIDRTAVGAACWRQDGAVVAVACAGGSEVPSVWLSEGEG